MSIHFVAYASQPHVRFRCDESWGYVWAGQASEDPKVFRAETGPDEVDRLYTFDETKVTCEACRAKMAAADPTNGVDPRAAIRRLAQRGLLNPGSDAALDVGCRCPVIENGHGRRTDGRFTYNLRCPVHGDESA